MTKEIFELPVVEVMVVETEDVLTWSATEDEF